jgi:hypothetical protein
MVRQWFPSACSTLAVGHCPCLLTNPISPHNGTYGRCEFCAQAPLCQPRDRTNSTATAGKPVGLSFRHALVAQGIEHRFPKPPGPSAVPWHDNPLKQALQLIVSCELCAVTQPTLAARASIESPPILPVMSGASRRKMWNSYRVQLGLAGVS